MFCITISYPNIETTELSDIPVRSAEIDPICKAKTEPEQKQNYPKIFQK